MLSELHTISSWRQGSSLSGWHEDPEFPFSHHGTLGELQFLQNNFLNSQIVRDTSI